MVCVALGNKSSSSSTSSPSPSSSAYCVPLFRRVQQSASFRHSHSQRKCINICAHFIELVLFWSGSHPHVLSPFPLSCSSPLFLIRHANLSVARSPISFALLVIRVLFTLHTQLQLLLLFLLVLLVSFQFAIKLICLIEINHRKYNLRHVSQV